ncbi:DNA polymerase III subunit alpha [Micropruina sonneratiae]|uniref:DNA polymerase III subunit alpha n=1 Tax=Micropruina sonneratiae TaxID=2986940 RepID=UPI0022266389|nr:DNA polymerase III subunit alpha [Micropruina sp. KQZ13P-5]MCW3157605.1 DNA polymerase III subunit alpha [Micropruina sp. KQZ13P-5]
MADGFVHLHCHSEYSMLDGAARLKDLVSGCEQMGMPALAVTDHGNLFGAYEWYKVAKGSAVKPIIGLEAYLTPKTHRSERKRVQFGDGTGDDVASKGAYTHMTMWAENADGMHNLFRLSSMSSLEGFFYKPRADRELLHRYGKGILATTGCPSGEVQTYLRLGQYQQALESAAEFRDIFGAGNFYCELMDHGLDIERRVRHDLLRIAKDLKLPLVATNDLHYVHAEDAEAHDTLLCVSSGSNRDTPNRFKFDGNGYYLKSPAEMRRIWAELPEACDNTLAIAERCSTHFDEGTGTFMAQFPVPAGETEQSWFAKEVRRGLEVRFPEGVPSYATEQAEFETRVITDKGYCGYFLVVADFINWAKNNGIRVGPGRGSGAGSMCAYALRITDLDPVPHGLIFERFLNPERPSMPDFDIDFDERRRGEVIRYVTEKYGDDHVCQIVTYGTIKAKQAIKDAGRVLGKPFGLGEKITKAYTPPVMGKDVPLPEVFNPEHARYAEGGEFRALYESDPEVQEVVDTARGIEGLKRQWGVHAAGVIMSSAPLLDVVPIMKRESDGQIITQFDYPSCEALGLVKMDFLGLRNLTILDDAIANVKANRGIDIDLDELSKDPTDPDTYRLLATGDTLGIFQLDGGGMRVLLRQMQPDNFEDISAALALYRPGPMGANSHTNYALRKTGKQPITAIHPELAEPLAEILDLTYGLIVYQEQVQQIAVKVANYTLGAADQLRRAMGKKKKEVLDAEFVNFEGGMQANGFSAGAIKSLWDILVPFSDYAFNKAHTAAYGLISYWTAYLKANYPAEYMAALLESVKNDKDKSAVYLAECRRMGIKVLPPDVNSSEGRFTPVGTDIRYGLAAIRNVGDNVVNGIVGGRETNGPASDFNEFLSNVPLVVCNKRVIESLIKAGAFDSLGHTRRSLMECYEQKVDEVIDLKRNQANGQDDLFGDFGEGEALVSSPIPEVEEWEKRVRLAFEREMLGLYVSDHPLLGLEHVLLANREHSIGQIVAEDGPRDMPTSIAGMITQVTRKQTRNGDLWAIVSVEDLEASIEVLLFPKVYQQVALSLATDTIVRIKGRIVDKDEGVEVRGSDVTFPDVSEGPSGPVVISLPAARCTPAVVQQLRTVLTNHPGATEVRVRLTTSSNRTTVWKLEETLRVLPSPPLMADLKALLGPSCVSV